MSTRAQKSNMTDLKRKLLQIVQYPIVDFGINDLRGVFVVKESVKEGELIKFNTQIFYLERFPLAAEFQTYTFHVVILVASENSSMLFPPRRELSSRGFGVDDLSFKAVPLD